MHLILVKPIHFGYLSILLVTSTALCGNIDIFNAITPIFCNGLFQNKDGPCDPACYYTLCFDTNTCKSLCKNVQDKKSFFKPVN